MDYQVICFGSALLDFYVKSQSFKKIPSGEFLGGAALCEEYGAKIEAEEAELTTGGGGTNVAVSMARKGLKTALVAEMGVDLAAAAIKEELGRNGVELDFLVQEEDERTGVSTMLVSNDGGRTAVIHRGASKMLTKSDMKWEELEASWFYISSLGGEMELLEGLIGHAKAKGIKVAVNPGKAEIEGITRFANEAGDRWRYENLFAGVEVLLVNREEAEMLAGTEYSNDEVWKKSPRLLGPNIVVVTDGRDGGKVWMNDKVIDYEVMKVEVVEETGAGDGFGSGLVAGLIYGKTIEEAIEWGKRQAASVVSFMGPKKGLLSLEEISK